MHKQANGLEGQMPLTVIHEGWRGAVLVLDGNHRVRVLDELCLLCSATGLDQDLGNEA